MNIIHIIKESGEYWAKQNGPRRAAALSYYTLFSLGPLAVIMLSIFQRLTSSININTFTSVISQFMNDTSLVAIEKSIIEFQQLPQEPILFIFSIVILIITAAAVIRELDRSLREMIEPEYRYTMTVLQFLKRYSLAIIGMIVVAFLFIAVFAMQQFFTQSGILNQSLLESLRFIRPISSLIIFVITFMITLFLYRYLPHKKMSKPGTGAFITAILVTLGQIAISNYLTWSGITTAFGAAGSLVVILLWIYYSSLVFFFGVSVTHVISQKQ